MASKTGTRGDDDSSSNGIQQWLELFAVSVHTLSFFSPLLIVPMLMRSWFRIAAVVYVVWCLAPRRPPVDSATSAAARMQRNTWWWSLVASYFPISLHHTQPLDPNRRYVFGYHPHGALVYGGFLAFATDALGFSRLFPGISNTFLIMDQAFKSPFFGDYIRLANVASVGRESCERILSTGGHDDKGSGKAITIAIGGEREVPRSRPGTADIVLKDRLGFVRVAIRHGADLVPVFAFGENDVFELLDVRSKPTLSKVEDFLFRWTGRKYPIFYTPTFLKYVTSPLPYRRPIRIVVGRPLQVQQQAEPDPDYVKQVHAEYVKELTNVWRTRKEWAGAPASQQLNII